MVSRVEVYLSSRQKLGYSSKREGQELLLFARYADEVGHRGTITLNLAVQWATSLKKSNAKYSAFRYAIVRRFAKRQVIFDHRSEILPPGYLGRTYERGQPHIYSEEEISDLLQAASKLRPNGGLRPQTYVTLFGLLASTGLRVSEALRLTLEDIDLNDGVLRIIATKFKKSRLVPIHSSTTQALQRYAKQRYCVYPSSTSKAFFVTERATRLKYDQFHITFTNLRKELGWIGNEHERAPNARDLRHTFAVRRLLRWYQEGADIDNKIHALATYLGHEKVTCTYWYLTAVPELLGIGASRFQYFSQLKIGGEL